MIFSLLDVSLAVVPTEQRFAAGGRTATPPEPRLSPPTPLQPTASTLPPKPLALQGPVQGQQGQGGGASPLFAPVREQ